MFWISLWRRHMLTRKLLFECGTAAVLLESHFSVLFIQIHLWTYCCNGKKKNFDSPETGTLEEDWTGTKMAYTKNYLKWRILNYTKAAKNVKCIEGPAWIASLLVDRLRTQKSLAETVCPWSIVGQRVICGIQIQKNCV